MPHCHGEGTAPDSETVVTEAPPEADATPPCHPDSTPETAPRDVTARPRGDWRHFLLTLTVLSAVLFAASVAAQLRIAPPPTVVFPPGATIYYNEACSDCATYLAGDLRPTLAAAGVSPVVVKDYINEPAYRQELRGINDALEIPFNLQSHLVTIVNVGNLTVLEGHVPGSLILQAIAAANATMRMLVHQDSMGTPASYYAWAFAGDAKQYDIATPLSAYVSWFAANNPENGDTSVALLPLVVATGFVDGLNPCAFAVLLFFVSMLYVTRRPRVDVARMGTVYIYAVFLAYLLIGLGLLRAIMLSGDPHLLARAAGILVVGIGGFVLVQPYMPKVPNPFHMPAFTWNRVRAWMKRGTDPSAGVAGFLVGLCTFPCSGGIYVAVLGLLAARTTYWEGLGYLYLYNLAFILPLVIVLLVVSNRRLARRATSWERGHTDLVRRGSAAAMIAVGLLTVFLA